MASQKVKRDLQEDLSNAFIDENAQTYAKEYKKHINAIQLSAINQVSKGIRPTQKSLRKGIRVTGINVNTRSAYILGSVSLLIQNDRDKALMRTLKPMRDLMLLYSVKNPRLFASKVNKLVKYTVGAKVPLNPRESRALKSIDMYLRQNKVEVQQLVDTNTKALKEINKRITTNQSKAIIKRRKALIRERITVNGVKRQLTNDEIASRLRSEFRDDEFRLNRILETETHRQNELTKQAVAKAQGFTKKTWNTQRDSKVRTSHNSLDRKTIPINAFFNVGGNKAQQPGASTLPPDESINCRCFLTYK